jgi:hypothetical protein
MCTMPLRAVGSEGQGCSSQPTWVCCGKNRVVVSSDPRATYDNIGLLAFERIDVTPAGPANGRPPTCPVAADVDYYALLVSGRWMLASL